MGDHEVPEDAEQVLGEVEKLPVVDTCSHYPQLGTALRLPSGGCLRRTRESRYRSGETNKNK